VRFDTLFANQYRDRRQRNDADRNLFWSVLSKTNKRRRNEF
jgi:hypothetical protein